MKNPNRQKKYNVSEGNNQLVLIRTGRCAEAVEDLFYQYVQLLEQQGDVDHKTVFIDGTKIESRAGRYTFNWRGTAEKMLAKAKQKVLEETGCKTLTELEQLLAVKAEGICFVSGKGKHKTEAQKEWEALDTRAWYRCEDCSNCPQRERCCNLLFEIEQCLADLTPEERNNER